MSIMTVRRIIPAILAIVAFFSLGICIALLITWIPSYSWSGHLRIDKAPRNQLFLLMWNGRVGFSQARSNFRARPVASGSIVKGKIDWQVTQRFVKGPGTEGYPGDRLCNLIGFLVIERQWRSGSYYRELWIPHWLLILLTGTISIGCIRYRRYWRQRSQIFRELCTCCEYDLRGTIAAGRSSCPECGVDSAVAVERWQNRRLHSRRIWKRFIKVVLILSVYAGSYVLLSRPSQPSRPSRLQHAQPRMARQCCFGGMIAKVFFFPARWVNSALHFEVWKQGWQARDWGHREHPIDPTARMEIVGRKARFVLPQPSSVKAWSRRLGAIDTKQFPIVVMRYRAINTDPHTTWYALWLDDGGGPSVGGFVVTWAREIIADGQVHELRVDMRKLELKRPLGPHLRQAALAVTSDDEGNAVFDLVELSFERATL